MNDHMLFKSVEELGGGREEKGRGREGRENGGRSERRVTCRRDPVALMSLIRPPC